MKIGMMVDTAPAIMKNGSLCSQSYDLAGNNRKWTREHYGSGRCVIGCGGGCNLLDADHKPKVDLAGIREINEK